MFQATLFGGEPVKVGRSNGIRQATLGFRSAVDSGRRGDPSPTWLDAVLSRLASAGAPAPSLADIQERWNARDTAEAAAGWLRTAAAMRDLVKRIRSQMDASPAPLSPIGDTAPAAILALPAPASPEHDAEAERRSDALDSALKMVRNGCSLRWSSTASGVPVTTIRRALGRVR